MTTIHLTDTQRDTFAACGLIVIDGEPMPWHVEAKRNERGAWCVYANGSFVSDYADREVRARHLAQQILKAGPPDLSTRAPEGWRILTESCDTCGGDGKRHVETQRGPRTSYFPYCPDCVGGRRVVTLTATCKACAPWDEQFYACDHCDNKCVVTLGRFTIPALLPVVDADDEKFDHAGLSHVCVSRDVVLLSLPGVNEEILDIDQPRPGQFIARPERVTEDTGRDTRDKVQ